MEKQTNCQTLAHSPVIQQSIYNIVQCFLQVILEINVPYNLDIPLWIGFVWDPREKTWQELEIEPED